MKIIKIIGLLLILSSSANLWSMGKHTSNVEEKEEKEDKEKSEGSNSSIFKIVFPNDTTEEEIIDINREDFISLSTFAELMDVKLKANELYILARVVTQEKDKIFAHYYDAHTLNQYLFGKYPLKEKMDQLKANPANQENIIAIEYFTIKKDENVFKYLCSHNDLFTSYRKQDLLDFFYFNSNDLKLKIYQFKKYLELQNDKKVRKYSEILCNQKVKDLDLDVWIQANHRLAHMHYANKDYKEALKYFEALVALEAQKDSPKIWIANVALVNIYYSISNNSPELNYEQTKKCCETCLAAPNLKEMNLDVWVKANYLLGNYYYSMVELDKINYNKAQKYFEAIAIPEVKDINLEIWAQANNKLGDIHCFGQGLLPEGIKKAKQFYELVSTNESIQKNCLTSWNAANYQLGYICLIKKEITGVPINYQKAIEYFNFLLSEDTKKNNLTYYNKGNFRLAGLYYGLYPGFPTNYKKAKEHFDHIIVDEYMKKSQAGLKIFVNTMYCLGIIYYKGLGLEKPDYHNALKHFKLVLSARSKDVDQEFYIAAEQNIKEIEDKLAETI